MCLSYTLLVFTGVFAALSPKKFLWSLPLLVIAFLYAPKKCPLPQCVYTRGVIYPVAIEKKCSHFKNGWVIQGYFQESGVFIPCSVYLKSLPKRISSYAFEGLCRKVGDYKCALWPKKPLETITPYPFLEARLAVMKKIESSLHRKVPSKVVIHFLEAFFFGEKRDLYLSYAFQSIGLSHILAISGFHFSLIAFLVFSLFRCVFSSRCSYVCSLFPLTVYACFLQNSPSSLRAFCVIFFYFLAEILGKQVSAANLLGASCLISLLIDPLSLFSPSFQLSYLSCAALLFFYPRIYAFLETVFPRQEKNRKEAFLYIARLLESAFCATAAIYLVTWPVILCHFSKISFASFFYNLCIPALLGMCMSIWALFSPICLFSPFASFLSMCTEKILLICLYPPVLMKNFVYLGRVSPHFAITWVSSLLFLGFTLQRDTHFRYDTN